jgi:outer membrane protein assembly factor BamB
MDRRTFLQMAMVAPMLGQTAKPKPSSSGLAWTRWGGPYGNFHTDATGIKDTWPASGPPVVWKRPLGEGYSSPSVEGDLLYTMYGRGLPSRSSEGAKAGEEVVIAVSAATGKTLWEHATPMTFVSDAAREQGNGPYATPLVVGDRLFTTGVAGRLQCLDKKTGKVVWTQQLVTDHRGSLLMYGYAPSPVAFRDLVIVPVGGRGRALMAFNQADGKVAWSANDWGNAYSTPVLIKIAGLDQLVALMDGAVIAVNPHNGDLQWSVPFKADYSIAISTPVFGPDNLMFVSSEYGGGAKVFELQVSGQRTTVKELWSSNRLRLHHGNAIRIGDAIYFSSGGKGSQAIVSAVDARSGNIHWQQRSIEKATFVYADSKLITLDQDGNLMIAYPSPQGFKIAAKAPIMSRLSWTPPVLVGTRLYLRDRASLTAVELG